MVIEFNDEQNLAAQSYASQMNQGSASGISGFLLSKGIAKDEAQANKIMLGIAVGAFVLTLIVIFTFVL